MAYKDLAFQKNFRKIRIRKGLTVQQLANITGLSRTIIYAYQQGKNFPTAKNLKHLAKALNCKVSDFFVE